MRLNLNGGLMQNQSKHALRSLEFIQEFNLRYRRLSRIIFFILLIALVLFSLWDGFVIGYEHPRLNDFVFERYLISLPFIIIGLFVSFSESNKARIDWWMTLCLLAIGLGTVRIYHLFQEINVYVSAEGLMLFMFSVYVVPSIFALQKMLVGMLTFVVYMFLLLGNNSELYELLHAFLYLGLINLGGAIHALSFDSHLRDNFDSRKILEKIAHTDHLTGAHNRHRFEEDFNQILEAARQEQAYLGLYIVDIDEFKQYNDHYGHLKGDECLVAIAKKLLGHCSHERDRCIRFGGEEFILVKYAASMQDLEKWGNVLLNGVRNLKLRHEFSSVADYVTVSIGAAFMQAKDKHTRASLMAKADAALYQAKKSGRNQLVLAKD